VRCRFTIVDLIGFDFEDLGSTIQSSCLRRRVISIHDCFFSLFPPIILFWFTFSALLYRAYK
jgi:hypothetical protein